MLLSILEGTQESPRQRDLALISGVALLRATAYINIMTWMNVLEVAFRP